MLVFGIKNLFAGIQGIPGDLLLFVFEPATHFYQNSTKQSISDSEKTCGIMRISINIHLSPRRVASRTKGELRIAETSLAYRILGNNMRVLMWEQVIQTQFRQRNKSYKDVYRLSLPLRYTPHYSSHFSHLKNKTHPLTTILTSESKPGAKP